MKAREVHEDGFYWMRLHPGAEWRPVEVSGSCVRVIGLSAHDHTDSYDNDVEFIKAVVCDDSGVTE